jgi:hypothetical protein
MNRNLIVVLCGIMLFATANPAEAQTGEQLYVYSPDGTEQTFALDRLKNITFTADGIQINTLNAGTVETAYSTAWTFTPRQVGINTPELSAIRVYYSNGNAIIESGEIISRIELYNMQGTLLRHTTPQTQSAVLPLQNYLPGLYLIRITCGHGKTETHKIINL